MPAATKIPDRYKDTVFTLTTYGDVYKYIMLGRNYGNNGRLRIDLIDEETGEPAATLTVNLVDDDPGEDAFFVKAYSENAQLVPLLLHYSGVFEPVSHPREVAWRFRP